LSEPTFNGPPWKDSKKHEKGRTTVALQGNAQNSVSDSERAISNPDRDVHALLHQDNFAQTLSVEQMNTSELAHHCMVEINNYRRGVPSCNPYGLELFHRALKQHDSHAWEGVQQCFNETVLHWMRIHPMRESARHFDSEENYVAQAFARFWLSTAGNQEIEFKTLAAALQYLRASLNGAIVDTLRTYSRPRQIALPEPGEPGEPIMEERDDDSELWEVMRSLLPEGRQQRVAYLLFHCHLKPREIVHYCPQEFSDVREIYALRRNIFERLLRNADYLRRRLDIEFRQ
jgi:hypothetical protein